MTVTGACTEHGIDVTSLTLDGDVCLTVRTKDAACFAFCYTFTLQSPEAVLDAENLSGGHSMLNFVSSVNLPSTNPQKLYEGTGTDLTCVEQFTKERKTESETTEPYMYPHIRIAPEVYGLSDTLPKSLTVSMTEANTEAALSTWAAGEIRKNGIDSSNSVITISDVVPAVAGSYTDQDGTDGSFTVTVKLTKNGISKTTTIPGTITATAYVAPIIASGIKVGTVNESGVFTEKTDKTFTCGDPIVFAVSYTANDAAVEGLTGTVACFDETKALTWSAVNGCYLTPTFTCPKIGDYSASYTIGEGGEYEQKTDTLSGLKVEGLTLQAGDFTFTPPANLIYDGSAKTATVSFAGSPACDGEVTIKYYLDGNLVDEAKQAGTYTVKIDVTASDYYKAADLTDSSWTFTIVKQGATAGTAPAANDLTYNTQPQALVTAGSSTSGTILYSTTENGSYSASVPTATDAGSYTVYWYVKGDETHQDSAKQSISVAIKAKNLSSDDVTIGSIADQTYNGSDLTPAVVVKDGEQTLVKDTDYTVAYENNKNAGLAAVTITGTGNYTGERSSTFTVAPKPLTSLDFSGITVTKVYDGTTDAGTLSGTVTFEGKCGSDDISIAAQPGAYAEGAADVGMGKSVTLTLRLAGSAAGNYTLTTGTYSFNAAAITKADGSVTAPVGTTGLVYSGTAQALLAAEATSTTGEVRYSLDGTNYGTEPPMATNAGIYTVYCKSVGDNNHFDAEANPIQVTIAQKTITITAKDQSIYVGRKAPDLSNPVLDKDYTVSGLVGEDQLMQAPTLTYDPAAPDTRKTGDAAAICAGDANAGSNYQIAYVDGVLKVTNRPSSASGSYLIQIADSDHGTVTVNPNSAEKGETVTITVKPDSGYTLETLTVTDSSGKEVKLTEKNGKYTFTMPASKVTVKATFMDDNSMLNFFYDVPNDAYYFEAVKWAVEKGITGGVGNDLFAPNQPCTRAQIVTFLWRAAGSPAPKSSEMPFEDVAAGSYYHDAVLWAVENGITKGTGDTTFSPDATCTRAQVVTFLWRYQKSPASGSVNPFTDVAADAYYANAVLWAVGEDVTNGTSDTTFSPNNDCTRAQIVTFLWRALAE